ncbi:cytochrome b-c1 complex subunit Rieske, mitochondrial-like [Panonychus citri]|uniref:cytochrome b-c1 complex subunit Rieske, mitochondrial-like n=1 Tax=Panonychus citri TaxID=50023 RepID=UPI002307A4BD|nr:cytochrome b-c1 complex subunit Rieske, mitochondrial-like [Panonychus citri]
MLSVVSRPVNFSSLIKATTQAVAVKSVGPAVLCNHENTYVPENSNRWSISSLSSQSIGQKISAVSLSINGLSQIRLAHTDIKVPDFTDVRQKATQDPTSRAKDSVDARRATTYGMAAGFAVGGALIGKGIVRGLAETWLPSKDVMALAKIEIKLNEIPEGKNIVAKWRGKPVFIRHRTAEEIEKAKKTNISELRDPQADEERTQDPKWLVVIGVCTHLGCVPISNAGDFGGYYCPCHGSHYDVSGRIRKGPAPANLEVPQYEIKDDLLVVG